MEILFKLIGALGLILITIGILMKNRKKQDLLFVSGGIMLEIYSIYIQDIIFIILQLTFILTALYHLLKQNNQTKTF